MFLEKVLEKENKKIDEKAKFEKRVLDYIIGIINSDYENFSKVFHKKIDKTFKSELGSYTKEIEEKSYESFKKEFFENNLYYEVKCCLNKVEYYFNRISGTIVSDEKNETSKEVQLGWVEYVDKLNGEMTFVPLLTEKGKTILEEYEKAKELR